MVSDGGFRVQELGLGVYDLRDCSGIEGVQGSVLRV